VTARPLIDPEWCERFTQAAQTFFDSAEKALAAVNAFEAAEERAKEQRRAFERKRDNALRRSKQRRERLLSRP
jgi:hypothetical protein